MPLEADVLAAYPAEVQIPAQLVAEAVAASAAVTPQVLVVLDDDPTGTQSVSDLPVLTRWDAADFTWAFAQGKPAVYVLTNTRSLDPAEAAARNEEIVRNALLAADKSEFPLRVGFVSRGDSTLRGHFPLEPDTIATTLAASSGEVTDGVVIVPAFPDAGRVTIGGVHYMRGTGTEAGQLTPVSETEFAKDASFAFAKSELAEYVAEKSQGRYPASSVIVLDLNIIRAAGPDGDPQVSAKAIADAIAPASGLTPIVADIVTENDLRALALGLEEAERRGKKLLYRVGPPFVRARIGQEIRSELSGEEAYAGNTPSLAGGLIVVGSHVSVTTRQLKVLTDQHSSAKIVEVDVERLLGYEAEAYLDDTVGAVAEALRQGDVIVHTSRLLIKTDDAADSLRIARTVSAAVVALVNRTLKTFPPRFVIAKGGITSSDVAAHGLEIRHAIVRGPMLPGIVSLWEPVDGPAKGIPYIVFAGNVGDDQSLAQVTRKLSTAFQSHHSTENIMSDNYTVTVLGLGAMGLPMATRLASELTVHGFDIAEARLQLAAEAGVHTFATAKEAAQETDALLLAVRNGEQLNDVLFGENGVASVLKPGAVVILTSTVGTEAIPATVERLAEFGVALVDAPLSGGPKRAGEGDLLIVVGADPAAYEAARPVLELLASTLTVVGDKPGDGQALKTVNQLLCGVHIAAAAEAMALADALGLDQAKTLAALEAGAAGSFMLSNRGPRILEAYTEEGAEVLSRLDIFVKDMGIVGKATRAAGLAAPVAAAAEQLYLLGQAQGLAAADDSAVIKVVAPTKRTA